MSKKLLIVRHAHAEEYAKSGKDFDRNLTQKGIDMAEEMATVLSHESLSFNLVCSSPAFRAKQTAELFAQHLAYPTDKIMCKEGIYEADLYDLVAILNRFEESQSVVAMFGHNPAFTYLADYLGDTPIDGLPKAGMVLIDFGQKTWSAISQGSGKTVWCKNPKNPDFW